MVIINSTLLNGEHIAVCNTSDEYWEEIKHHGNMVVYHYLELKEFQGLSKYEAKDYHEVKRVFFNIGEITPISPKKMTLTEMRNKLRKSEC